MKHKIFILFILSIFIGGCATKNTSNNIVKIDEEFSKDNNKVYQKHNCLSREYISQLDPKTFEVIDNCYIKDSNNVFVRPYCGQDCLYEKIIDADSSSFNVLTSPYSKDSNAIYFRTNKVGQADVNSFQVIEKKNSEPEYAKDNKNVYLAGKLIKDASTDSFEIISSHKVTGFYAKDKNFVYCGTEKILGADVATFDFLPNSQEPGYYQDKNNTYYECEIVK